MNLKISKIGKTLLVLLLWFIFNSVAQADYSEYTSSIQFIIPWGYVDEAISPDFTLNDPNKLPIEAPGPWAISNQGKLGIVYRTYENEFQFRKRYLKLFANNGSFLHSFDLSLVEDKHFLPQTIAFADSGEIALAGNCGDLIVIFDQSLNIISQTHLPDFEHVVFYVGPCSTGGFWVLFSSSSTEKLYDDRDRYIAKLNTSGELLEIIKIWDGINKTGILAQFVSPEGIPSQVQMDEYGCFYGPTQHISGELGSALSKRIDQFGVMIYRNDWLSEENWSWFDLRDTGYRFFIEWDGDYYTLHATETGIVLTKYTYQPE